MLWVTWRHHRGQMAACLGLVAAASMILVLLGLTMHSAWSAGPADWVLSSGLTNAGGGRLSAQAESAVLHAAQTAGGPQENYLRSHGYGHWALIQPAGRFWHFQILEAAIYTLLALACLVAAVLVLRRHPC